MTIVPTMLFVFTSKVCAPSESVESSQEPCVSEITVMGIDSSSIQGDFELLGAGDILDLESERYLFCPIVVLVTSEYRFEIRLLVAPIDKSHIRRIVAVAYVLAPVEEEVLILVLQKVWSGHLVEHLSDCREIRLP